MSYTEHCYNKLADELKERLSILAQVIPELQKHLTYAAFASLIKDVVSDRSQRELLDDQSMIVFTDELMELSALAFEKTNIEDDEIEMLPSTPISTQHLDTWTRPDFVIKLSNHDDDDDDDDDDVSYHVHKLILCGRWKYFSLMIESGLKEVNENEMTLSDDWNKSRIESFLKYIYLNEVHFDELEDVEWLMENRRLYGIAIEKIEKHNNNANLIKNDDNKNNIEPNQSVSNELGLHLDLKNYINIVLMFYVSH